MASNPPPNRPAFLGPGPREFSVRVAVAGLILILLFCMLYVVWNGIYILLEAFGGLLFAVFLSTLSTWLSRATGLGRGKALLLVMVGLLLVAGGLGWLLYSRLATQITELIQRLPQAFGQIRSYLQQYEWGRLIIENVPDSAQTLAAGGLSRFTGLIGSVQEIFVGAVIIFVVGIFGAAEPKLYRDGLLHLVPHGRRRRVEETLDAIDFNLHWWMLGQVFLMFAVGITSAVGLWLIGVPLALALGVITGLLEIVPYIGPWLSVIPAALIALLLSPTHFWETIGLYLALHLLEGYVLMPLVQRQAVLLPPALTLVAQLLMGKLVGFIGLLVAAPFTVTVVIMVKMLYVEDTLADTNVNIPGAPGGVARAEADK